MSKPTKLKFAGLIRVSTEKQEKEGESLRTQKSEITDAVKQLGGQIVSWYGGQEHATPGYEKKEIDRLIADGKKNVFTAVIVNNADRWSRDNNKSEEGLKVFEANDIRFFVGQSEYDLHNPEHRLFLGMSSVIGHFLASNQKRKSILNRIGRAKRGIPACGKLPYGRTFDKQTGKWGIDPEKKNVIEQVASRYLAGESMGDLAAEYGINHAALHKTVMHRSGEEWQQEFRADDLKIHETVIIKIPRLLPQSTIKKLHAKAKANKTYCHGQLKNRYLLSRMIFCGHCGYVMFGQTNHNGKRYYRHTHHRGRRVNCTDFKSWIRCDDIEETVIRFLFDMFGSQVAMEKAIEKTIPNKGQLDKYRRQAEHTEKQLQQISNGRDRILKLIAKDTITDAQAEKQLNEINVREGKLKNTLNQLNQQIAQQPDDGQIRQVSRTVRRRLAVRYFDYHQMTYEDKRALLQLVFSGTLPNGKRMGVYCKWNEDGITFDIKGHLIELLDLKPMNTDRLNRYFETEETKSALY